MDKKILSVNIINFAKVDKGGGGKTLIHQKWIISSFYFFILTLPLSYYSCVEPDLAGIAVKELN